MKQIWIILISVVISGGLVGGGTYYLVSAKTAKDKDSLNKQLSDIKKDSEDLSDQVSKLTAESKTLASVQTAPTATPTPTATSTDKTITLDELKNATYSISEISGNFKLSNGQYSYKCAGGTCTATLATDLVGFGEMNSDKFNEAAVILAYNTGGTGTEKYLAVFNNNNGQPQFSDSKLLTDGDYDSLTISAGLIQLQAHTYAPGDPNCCPSVSRSFSYGLVNGKLVSK